MNKKAKEETRTRRRATIPLVLRFCIIMIRLLFLLVVFIVRVVIHSFVFDSNRNPVDHVSWQQHIERILLGALLDVASLCSTEIGILWITFLWQQPIEKDPSRSYLRRGESHFQMARYRPFLIE